MCQKRTRVCFRGRLTFSSCKHDRTAEPCSLFSVRGTAPLEISLRQMRASCWERPVSPFRGREALFYTKQSTMEVFQASWILCLFDRPAVCLFQTAIGTPSGKRFECNGIPANLKAYGPAIGEHVVLSLDLRISSRRLEPALCLPPTGRYISRFWYRSDLNSSLPCVRWHPCRYYSQTKQTV